VTLTAVGVILPCHERRYPPRRDPLAGHGDGHALPATAFRMLGDMLRVIDLHQWADHRRLVAWPTYAEITLETGPAVPGLKTALALKWPYSSRKALVVTIDQSLQLADQRQCNLPFRLGLGSVASSPIGSVALAFGATSLTAMQPADCLAPHG
jgi:hypothetical protein